MRVRVPAKLMIAGEYSVLGPDGEALAIAVGPGLEASARPSERWTLVREDTGRQWSYGSEVPTEFAFAEAALRAAIAAFDYQGSPMELCFGNSAGTGEKKQGLGGSASAVAATTALVRMASGGTLQPAALLPPALAAHNDVQQGRGSGYDVATVVYGGLVRWRPARVGGTVAAPYEVERIALPEGLHFLAGYSGRSALTTDFISRMEAASKRDPLAMLKELTSLGRAAGGLIDAFCSGEPARIVTAVPRCHGALCEWDTAHQFGIVTDEVKDLIAMAEDAGAVAKVSGAGGGDSVLAFAEDSAVMEALSRDWGASGYRCLALNFGSEGPTAHT